MNLRELIQRRRERGMLVETMGEVDPNLEAASVLAALDGRSVYFPKVRGSAMPIAGNLVSSRELLADALGVEPKALIRTLAKAQAAAAEPPVVERGPCQEIVIEPADVGALPVLRHLATDGGPYITSAVVVVQDPVLGRNLSFHRLMVTGPDRATIRVVKQRGLDKALLHSGGEADVAVLIGAPPQVLLAAATSPPDDVDEMRIAQALAPTPLVRCRTVDLMVPAETEIVIEARITSERGAEGPFIDLTETMDFVRQEPVVRFKCVTRRRDAIYHALLPGKGDHKTLMGLPREADIYREVRKVCDCLDVAMRPGGCSWLHATVQIRKQSPQDPKEAVRAALKAHPSLKLIIVVDEDIDPHDDRMVEWAMATRFQADRGVVIYENMPSSSLDPSAHHPPGQKSIGAKLGIDATARERSEEYRRLDYPGVSEARRRELGVG